MDPIPLIEVNKKIKTNKFKPCFIRQEKCFLISFLLIKILKVSFLNLKIPDELEYDVFFSKIHAHF
jgi:hypothetical protein